MCEFTSHSAIPVQFMFNLYYLDWLPETDCIDVIRHEYALSLIHISTTPEAHLL